MWMNFLSTSGKIDTLRNPMAEHRETENGAFTLRFEADILIVCQQEFV